jgi:hypothetical protein
MNKSYENLIQKLIQISYEVKNYLIEPKILFLKSINSFEFQDDY